MLYLAVITFNITLGLDSVHSVFPLVNMLWKISNKKIIVVWGRQDFYLHSRRVEWHTFTKQVSHHAEAWTPVSLFKKGTECVLGPNPLGLKPWLRNQRPISNAVRRRGPAHRYLNHHISLFMAVLWIAYFWGLQLEDGTDGEGPVWSDLAVGKAPSIQSW